MFLFGLMAAVAPSVVPKVTVVWFPGKRLGLATGLLYVAWSFGAVTATLSSATLLSQWLGGWRNVLFFFGAPPLLLGILWWLTGREPQQQEASSAAVTGEPLRTALAKVTRIKEVWIMGVVLLTYWGTNMGFGGYLPLYLRNIGWEPVLADSAMTVFSGIGVFGVIPMVLYSDKIGSRKTVMIFSTIVLALSIGLLPIVSTTGIWILLIIGGLIRIGVTPLATTLIFEIKGVGSTYGGTAIGLTNSLGMLGAFAAAPIGNSFATFSSDMPLFFWSLLGALALPLLFLLKETGTRAKVAVS
jgi:predicted MFS family arabinose efflux permease